VELLQDKRADIWAFGVVLFEMLAGRPLFGGDTISDTLAAVLKAEPRWSDLPSAVSPRLRQLLRWCLEKDPKRRLRDIGDARIQIDEALGGAPEETPPAPRAPRPLVWRALPWIVAGALTLALALNLGARRSQPTPVLRTFSHVGADVTFTIAGADVLAISPDGATVSFVAQSRGGSTQLFVRRLDRLDATPLPGTEGATQPFFSPDGTRIGFFAGGLLKTVAVTGGAPATLCPVATSRGGAWGDDETIVYTGNRVGPLMRVSSRGGQPVPLAAAADGEVTQRWPQFLPGGRKVLFTSNRQANEGYSDANLVVYDIPNGTRKIVREGGYHGRYVRSGHLVYLQEGTLFGTAFDIDRLEVIGAPVSIIDGILTQADSGAAQFDVSASGTLVYQPGPVLGGGGSPIEWVGVDGTATALRTTPANWFNLRLASDGRRLALQIGERDSDIWIYEWSRNNLSRVTLDQAGNSRPVWTRDACHLAFASTRGGAASNLYWQRVGQGEIERLTDSPNGQWPGSFHPSGKYLAYEEQNADGNLDVMILPLEGDEASGWKPGKATAFQRTSVDERDPVFSPDGRWLAYVSRESGRDEIHVRSFPGAGSKVVMSSGGGGNPVWSPTRNELFYGSARNAQGQITVVPFVVKDGVLIPEAPRQWSSVRYQQRGPNRMFDVSSDGTRLALARVEQVEGRVSPDHLAFVFNFFDHLRAAAGPSR
jgi:Tol biopolymer transport system component